MPVVLASCPPLRLRRPDLASVDALCAAIGEQAACLVPHEALYIYWGEPGAGHLDLRLALIAVEAPPLPFPDYAGWLRESSYTPVPVTLPMPDPACHPRPWSGGAAHWLDLPVLDRLLLRYRLPPDFTLLRRHRLRISEWMQASAAVLARAPLP